MVSQVAAGESDSLSLPTPSTAADVFRLDSASDQSRWLIQACRQGCEKRWIASVTATRKPRDSGLTLGMSKAPGSRF